MAAVAIVFAVVFCELFARFMIFFRLCSHVLALGIKSVGTPCDF